MNDIDNFVGVIPAAGFGRRLRLKNKSKEILPVMYPHNLYGIKEKVISSFLIDQLENAGIKQIFMIIRTGKWDIPKYYAENKISSCLSFIVILNSESIPHTINFSYPYIKNKFVILSFPDLIIYPKNAILKCKLLMQKKKADIVLGLFPVNNSSKFDIVEFDNRKKIKGIITKNSSTNLKYAWTIAIWNAKFTEYMHSFIDNIKFLNDSSEMQLSEIILSAIKDGFNVELKLFYKGKCLDIGTKDDYNYTSQFLKNCKKEI